LEQTLSDQSHDPDQEFVDQLRAIWKETSDFQDPPPETIKQAKALFARRQKAQKNRRLLIFIGFIAAIIGIALIFFWVLWKTT